MRIKKKGIIFVEASADFNIDAPAVQVDIGEINVISVEDFSLALRREIETADMPGDQKMALLEKYLATGLSTDLLCNNFKRNIFKRPQGLKNDPYLLLFFTRGG